MEPLHIDITDFMNEPNKYNKNGKCYFVRDNEHIYKRKETVRYLGKFQEVTAYKAPFTEPRKLIFEHYTFPIYGGHGGGPKDSFYELPECLTKAEGDAALPALIKSLDKIKIEADILNEMKNYDTLTKAHIAKLAELQKMLEGTMSGGSRNNKTRKTRKSKSKRTS